MFIPSETTMLQSIDIAINMPLKDKVRSEYVSWPSELVNNYSNEIIPPHKVEKMLELSLWWRAPLFRSCAV